MSRFYLATYTDVNIWDKDSIILTFNESCEGLDSEVVNKFKIYKIISLWLDKEKQKIAIQDIHLLYEKYLPALCNQMETTHNVVYSQHAWRIIVGPWFFQVISVLYDRFYSVKNALELYPDLNSHILDSAYIDIPKDSFDLHYLLTDDLFNFWIYSEVLKFNNCDFPFIQKKRDTHIAKPNSGKFKERLKNILRSFNILLLRIFSFRVKMIGYSTYIPLKYEYLFTLLTAFKFLPLIPFKRVYNDSDISLSSRIRMFDFLNSGESKFEIFLGRVLPKLLPKSLNEDFKYISEKVNNLKLNPDFLVSAESWHYDEFYKRLAANHFDNSKVLIGIQHGGTYGGIQSYIPNEIHEKRIVDKFYTWGWSNIESKNVIPFYAIKLTGKRDINYRNNEKILFVGTGNSRYLINFQFVPSKLAKYFSDQHVFLSALDSRFFNIIKFRFFQQEYGWNYLSKLKLKFPAIQFDDGSINFLNALNNYRICIIDHVSTTWLEALALNIPTVIYGYDSLAEPNTEILEYLSVLKKARILHDTPSEAAEFLMKVYDNVESWWDDNETQKARLLICNKFAKKTESPTKDYMNNFFKIYLNI